MLRLEISYLFSFEVGVRVEAYRYEHGKIAPTRHINSAFLTYDINVDADNPLPEFIPEKEVSSNNTLLNCVNA